MATVRHTAALLRAHRVIVRRMAIVLPMATVRPVRLPRVRRVTVRATVIVAAATVRPMATARRVRPVLKVSAQTASDLKLVYSVLQIAKQALHRRQGSTTSSKPEL